MKCEGLGWGKEKERGRGIAIRSRCGESYRKREEGPEFGDHSQAELNSLDRMFRSV